MNEIKTQKDKNMPQNIYLDIVKTILPPQQDKRFSSILTTYLKKMLNKTQENLNKFLYSLCEHNEILQR